MFAIIMHNLNIKLFCLKGLEFIGDCEWCCTCYRVSDENGSVNYRMDTRHFIHIISSLCAVNFIMEQGLPATQKSDVAHHCVPEIPMSAFSALEPFTLFFTIKDN